MAFGNPTRFVCGLVACLCVCVHACLRTCMFSVSVCVCQLCRRFVFITQSSGAVKCRLLECNSCKTSTSHLLVMQE